MADHERTPPAPEPLFRRREWTHGDEGHGRDCDRYNNPVYTDPQILPQPCQGSKNGDVFRQGPDCGNEHWVSKGHVLTKENNEVVRKEYEPGWKPDEHYSK